MITVQIHDDGKGKNYSLYADLNESESDINVFGSGENKEEAIYQLKLKVDLKIIELQSIDYNNITWVDCTGNPIS